MKYLFKMFSFMRPFMLTYIPGLILYCSQSFVFPLMSAFFSRSITAAVLEVDTGGIIAAALIFIAMYTVSMPLLAAGVVMYVTSEIKAMKALKTKLFRCFVKNSLEETMSSHSGEGIAAINTDADTAGNVFGNSLSPFLSSVITIVFSALVVFLIDYRLGIASIVIGLMAFYIQYKFAKPLGEIGTQTLSANAASVKEMSNVFSGALAIRAFNAQNRAIVSFDKENDKLKMLSFRQAFISMWQDFFTTIQGWLSLSGVFAFGGYLVATGRLSFPDLMMVPVMCGAIAHGMSAIGSAWAALQAPIAASKRVFGILDKFQDTVEPQNSVKPDGYALEINDLNFKYLSAQTDSLSEVDLKIAENEMVAFVGESGSGKSTLLRTILGMYERGALNMRLGNLEFSKNIIKEWRGRFAYVDQSCKLFNMTIAENIALGGNKPGLDEVKSAAVKAYADGFINELSEGYNTQCGEKGASLSGGQKQRIAIARALVRNAPVLVFDEATSALDLDSERQIMETINRLRGSHTILITTHNLQNTVTADKIIVMDKGRIVETGHHAELMEKDGLYKRLYLQGRKEFNDVPNS